MFPTYVNLSEANVYTMEGRDSAMLELMDALDQLTSAQFQQVLDAIEGEIMLVRTGSH